MPGLTLFSSGYYGWSTATKQLIKTFNAVEAVRGFHPPLFVDIRFGRSVRAPGFRQKVFEKQIGQANYRWMKPLGNKAMKESGPPRIYRPGSSKRSSGARATGTPEKASNHIFLLL